MKVFKFYSDDLYYAYSGHNEYESKETMFEEIGIIPIDKVEEIPESEWDEKTINIWEDNNKENLPFKVSIRECLEGEMPILIYSNDID